MDVAEAGGHGFTAEGVSVVVPVYNEQESIRDVLMELADVMRTLRCPFEIICVDDGSSDGSPGILQALKAGPIPEMRVMRLVPNSGQSAAFGTGFREAAFPVTVTMDADGQNDPADIPTLLAAMGQADLCCGYRAKRRDSWSKRMGSRIGNGVRNWLLGARIIDTGCSLKAFRTEQVRRLPMLEGMHRFLPNLCVLQGATIRQIPVNHRPRLRGTSKYSNFGRLLKTVPDVLAVYWMKRRTRRFTVKEV
jgi:dolichol-phosphate mannosyltransferase